MVRLVTQSHTRACAHCPTCAPIPRQVVPQPRTRACTHCPTCAPIPRQVVPQPRAKACTHCPTCAPSSPQKPPRPVLDLHPPHTRTPILPPSSDSFRLCPCRHPRRGRPRPRTHNSRACAKRSSPGSTRTNASCPCAHLEHRPGERWLAKS